MTRWDEATRAGRRAAGRITLALLLLGGPSVAYGGSRVEAERYRLETELDRHASANRWKAVERDYVRLLQLQVPLSTRTHYTAALAAESQGDILATWQRLERAIRHENALDAPPLEDGTAIAPTLPASIDRTDPITRAALKTYNSLLDRYGRVSISVKEGRIPALVRLGAKPFGSTEREAIRHGQRALASASRFVGLLPVGRYMVDGESFEVKPGELTIVQVEPR